MRKVPVSVMVLSIIGIIVGVLGFCGVIWSVLSPMIQRGHSDPMQEALRRDSVYQISQIVSFVLHAPLSIWLLVCSISSLRLLSWARRGMVAYALIGIFLSLVGSVFSLVYLTPKMAAAAPPGLPGGPRFVTIIMVCGTLLGVLLNFAFCGCILYFFRRPHVIDAFNGIFHAPPGGFPVGRVPSQTSYPPQ